MLAAWGLFAANHLTASVSQEPYQFERGTHVVYNTPGIPDSDAWDKYEADRIAAEKKAAMEKAKAAAAKKVAVQKVAATAKRYCEPQCVTYAKALTGVGGTWGNGGRKLSLNSDGDIGDVVIFKTIHVGVVVDKVNGQRIVAEANHDFKCGIRTRVLKDSEVRGYHKF